MSDSAGMDNPIQTSEAIFESARGIHDPVRRAEFLSQACVGDARLLERVNIMLAKQAEANEFFAEPGISAPPRDAVPLAEMAGDTIGPYRLVRQLGEGGCGVVYLAEQERLVQRQVALKIMKPGMDTREVIARFRNEWQALALMNHPSIARVLDAGVTHSGRPYFVMEYVEGTSLTAYCDNWQLAIPERLELMIEVCAAVQHAHQKGIIHRDLKPGNVLVALQDNRPLPKVIDFGIAKALGISRLTTTLVTQLGLFLGTPSYMSPEQATRGDLDMDTRSDIYSLGVLLYELLTGTTPFPAEELLAMGMDQMLQRIRHDDPMRPSVRVRSTAFKHAQTLAAARDLELGKWWRTLRGDLDWIVMKCLEKDRARRYNSASGLARDLQRFLNSEPVAARPPGLVYQVQKWARRNRLLAGATTVALLGLAGGGVMLGHALVREQRAHTEAIAAERNEAALRVEAEWQRDRAARGERDSRAMLDFLLHRIVDAAAPHTAANGLGPDVSLRSALLAAVPEIGQTFSNQPLAELELRERLATTFTELGLFTNAILELEHAVALADKHLGRERIQTLENIGRIAWAYQQIPDPVQHLACLTQTWQRAIESFGSTSEIALKWQGQLGVGHRDQGDFPTAIQILESALAASRPALRDNHPLTYGLMNNLAIALNLAGDPAYGVPLLEETVLWRKRHLGSLSADTTRSMLDLATAYLQIGRDAEAIALVAEALRLRRASSGESGAETLLAYEGAALAFHTTGHWQIAAGYWDTAQILRGEAMGPSHPLTRLASQRLIEARTKRLPQSGHVFRH